MSRLAVAIIVAGHFVVAGAQAETALMTVVHGNCQAVQIAGQTVECRSPSDALYVSMSNGTIFFSVALADGRIYAFAGDHDSQPKPELYVLSLKRVELERGGEEATRIDVSGTCTVDFSTDGKPFPRLLCDATDRQSAKYLLDFRGDQPVQLKRFSRDG